MFLLYLFIDLRKPVYSEDGSNKIVFIDEPLMTAEELQRFLEDPRGGKHLVWINYFQEIPDTM